MQCPTPISLKHPHGKTSSQRLTVPCGKCGACIQNRRADWSFRLSIEARYAGSSAFITLTYSDENRPLGRNDLPSLYKPDLQKWIKRVRKKHPMRYFAVGEYGTETELPHYHILAFFQEKFIDLNKLLTDTWTGGIFHIGKISESSIHYCTKFHITVNKNLSDDLGRIPEFAQMSLKPAIGYQYINLNKEWHQNENWLHTRDFVVNHGFIQRVPRYYREKLFSTMTLAYLRAVYQRKNEKETPEEKFDRLSLTKGEYFRAILSRAQAVRRKVKRDRF